MPAIAIPAIASQRIVMDAANSASPTAVSVAPDGKHAPTAVAIEGASGERDDGDEHERAHRGDAARRDRV